MSKGNKFNRWYKEGLKISRKLNKKYWNRKVRHLKYSLNRSNYKKIAKDSMYDGIL